MPGVDVLGIDNREYDAVLQCASVANQLGRRRVVSETCGATGWNLSFEQQKSLLDWQLALGVNSFCLHLAFYTMAGAAKRDYPPSFSFQSAWWRHYRPMAKYVARTAAMLSRGRPDRGVLVIHPIESTWLRFRVGWERATDVKRLDQALKRLRDGLLRGNVAFDYGDEVIMSESGRVATDSDGPCLIVGRARYRTVIVPSMLTIRSSTMRLLDRFRRAGGRIIWIGSVARRMDAQQSTTPLELAARCERSKSHRQAIAALGRCGTVQITGGPAGPLVLSHVRHVRGRLILFICNTSRRRASGTLDVRLEFRGALKEWDPVTGAQHAVQTTRDGRGMRFNCELPRCGSRLFVASPAPPDRLNARPTWRDTRFVRLPADGWRYRLAEPNPLVLDFVRVRFSSRSWSPCMEILKADSWLRQQLGWQPRRYHDAQPWADRPGHTSVEVDLKAVFALDGTPPSDAYLAMERTHGTARVNGEPLDLHSGIGGWVDPCFELHSIRQQYLRRGHNELLIISLD